MTHASNSADSSASTGKAAAAAVEPNYQQIALSAYAHHRRITTRVKSDEPSTPWAVAGRIREPNQRKDRN